MRLAVIDLDWLDNRISASIEKDVITELKTVKQHTISFLNSFSLSDLNLNTAENRETLYDILDGSTDAGHKQSVTIHTITTSV